MSNFEEGVIKYDRSGYSKSGPLPHRDIEELETWRLRLYKLGLIGEYPIEKVGFGNLSMKKDYSSVLKSNTPQFIITGTQTGKFQHLNGEQYTRVIDFDIESMKLIVNGPMEASSEAITHAAFYSTNSMIKACFHIHSKKIWEGIINDAGPTTPKDVPYGTKEMALAVSKSVGTNTSGFLAMEGHEEGVFSFGSSCEEAGGIIQNLFDKYQ